MAGEVELYSSYIDLKGWNKEPRDDFTELNSWLKPLVNSTSRILEIGFGDGQALRWARGHGCEVTGVEIIPELVSRAKQQGFDAFSSLDDVKGKFDTLLAMDVFEHLTVHELSEMLHKCRGLLRVSGLLVARFPNGASPFCAYYQSGDATHLKPLSPRALDQIARPAGFELVTAFNPRSIRPGFSEAMKDRTKFFIRDVIERLYGKIYYGRSFPLDPNVVVVLGAK
jgi:hypothetical protein